MNLHWGAEYRHAPTPSQWNLARFLTASPAVTAVVGQHAHVVQPIRFLNGKPVVFGEGNLLSNQSGASEDGLIALLDLAVDPRGARTLRVRYLPTHVRRPDYAVVPPGETLVAARSPWRDGRHECSRSRASQPGRREAVEA